jgi:hypothetical protein
MNKYEAFATVATHLEQHNRVWRSKLYRALANHGIHGNAQTTEQTLAAMAEVLCEIRNSLDTPAPGG